MTNNDNTELITAPDGCTVYLRSFVKKRLDQSDNVPTLRIDFVDEDAKIDMATWCLEAGVGIRNPFAHFSDLSLVVSK